MNIIVCLDDKNGMMFNKRRQSQDKLLRSDIKECNENDFCLVEDKSLYKYIDKINTIVIYNWNRIYPTDLHFDIDLNNNSWELMNESEFEGSSHEKITKKIYRRIH